MEITRGTMRRPLKVVIYGPEGIGKTTFASAFPAPVFIDTENSTDFIDVARFPKPSSWTMLLQEVEEAKRHTHEFQTLVIDTADWAEMMCKQQVCESRQIKSIEDPGYGKGYVYQAEEWGKFLNALTSVRDAGLNIVLTAHAMMRKFEQPDELGAYDRWELKLEKKIAPMTKEWADMILFANYEVHAVKTGDAKGAKSKAQGGKRVMYASHHPCWDAKNRQGLPDKLEFSFSKIEHCFPVQASAYAQTELKEPDSDLPFTMNEDPKPQVAETRDSNPGKEDTSQDKYQENGGAPMVDPIPKAVSDLMKSSNVTEEQVRRVIESRGYGYFMDTAWHRMEEDGFVQGWVIPFWPNIIEVIHST